VAVFKPDTAEPSVKRCISLCGFRFHRRFSHRESTRLHHRRVPGKSGRAGDLVRL